MPLKAAASGPAPFASVAPGVASPKPPQGSSEDVFARLERLAGLHKKGVLTDEEFAAKKAELLDRI
jgi:hypothetical protein